MRNFVFAAALLAPLAIVGCAGAPPVTSDVSAAEIALTSVESAARVYVSLPRCQTPKPTAAPCSDVVVVAKIKSLDNQAYNAVIAARADEALVGAALTAIQALVAAVPAL